MSIYKSKVGYINQKLDKTQLKRKAKYGLKKISYMCGVSPFSSKENDLVVSLQGLEGDRTPKGRCHVLAFENMFVNFIHHNQVYKAFMT